MFTNSLDDDEIDLKPDTDLREVAGVDSLTLEEVATKIEDQFMDHERGHADLFGASAQKIVSHLEETSRA